MVEQADKSEISTRSRTLGPAYEGGNDKEHEHMLDKQSQYLKTNVIDVFGKKTEPICDYLRCHHNFSEYGLRASKCQCKHPRNSAAGAYFLLHTISCVTNQSFSTSFECCLLWQSIHSNFEVLF